MLRFQPSLLPGDDHRDLYLATSHRGIADPLQPVLTFLVVVLVIPLPACRQNAASDGSAICLTSLAWDFCLPLNLVGDFLSYEAPGCPRDNFSPPLRPSLAWVLCILA